MSEDDVYRSMMCFKMSIVKFYPLQRLEITYTPLDWIHDDVNAISYYSVRNATAHMHRKKYVFMKMYV